MTNKKKAPAVMSRRLHEAEVMALQVQINNLKTDVAYQKTIVGAQKEELEMKANALKQRLEDNQILAATYGNLKREFEMMKVQFKNELIAEENRVSEANSARDKARREANAAIEMLMERKKPWYKKLFNVKTK